MQTAQLVQLTLGVCTIDAWRIEADREAEGLSGMLTSVLLPSWGRRSAGPTPILRRVASAIAADYP